jgi:hypothetical protein
MSTFENNHYQWRETYFVLFDASRRPTLAAVEKKLGALGERFQLSVGQADEEGRFESITLRSPSDFSAVDISYVEGEEVLEQGAKFGEELSAADEQERKRIRRLPELDGRFDVMHFEEVVGGELGDEPDEILDPSALLAVMAALVELTDGVGVDPQAGALA